MPNAARAVEGANRATISAITTAILCRVTTAMPPTTHGPGTDTSANTDTHELRADGGSDPPPRTKDVPTREIADTEYHSVKPRYTTAGGTIHIHPDGSPEGAGTREDPVDGFTAADRLAGTLNLHRITMRVLAPITVEESPMLGPYIGTMVKQGGVHVVGEGDRPAVRTTDAPGFLTLGAWGLNPLETIHVENLDLHTGLQVYGTAFIEDCTLRPTDRPTSEARQRRCLAGYNNYVRVQDSTFTENPASGAADAAFGIACKDNGVYHLHGNTFEVSTAAVTFYGGGGTVVPFGENDVATPEHGWQVPGDKPEPL